MFQVNISYKFGEEMFYIDLLVPWKKEVFVEMVLVSKRGRWKFPLFLNKEAGNAVNRSRRHRSAQLRKFWHQAHTHANSKRKSQAV